MKKPGMKNAKGVSTPDISTTACVDTVISASSEPTSTMVSPA